MHGNHNSQYAFVKDNTDQSGHCECDTFILNRLSSILQNVSICKYHLCSVILSIFLHDYTAEAYA